MVGHLFTVATRTPPSRAPFLETILMSGFELKYRVCTKVFISLMMLYYDVTLKYRKRNYVRRVASRNRAQADSRSWITLQSLTVIPLALQNVLRSEFNISSIQNSMTDTGWSLNNEGLAKCYVANLRWQRVPPSGFRLRYARPLNMRATISKSAYWYVRSILNPCLTLEFENNPARFTWYSIHVFCKALMDEFYSGFALSILW